MKTLSLSQVVSLVIVVVFLLQSTPNFVYIIELTVYEVENSGIDSVLTTHKK